MNDARLAKIMSQFTISIATNYDGELFAVNSNGTVDVFPIPCVVEFKGKNSRKKKEYLTLLYNEINSSIKKLSYGFRTHGQAYITSNIAPMASLLGMKKSIAAQLKIEV